MYNAVEKNNFLLGFLFAIHLKLSKREFIDNSMVNIHESVTV